jgi:ubiquinone/menaquinone biosynthesis C-methylase UbiE
MKENEHQIQKEASHYFSARYIHRERWLNYWYQIHSVCKSEAKRVLEIGVGNGLVADTLRKIGVDVETIDIDPELKPTHVASVTHIPVEERAYDFVLCAEVLEHLPFEAAEQAMKEVARVTKRHALITLPHAGTTFSFLFKIPLLRWQFWNWKIPHAWKDHAFDGQHYWEAGKRGYSDRRIRQALEGAGLRVMFRRIHPDDPAHVFYLCERA